MATRHDCGKRSRPMAASTCWRSRPTPVCGASGPRWRSHKSRLEDGHGSRHGWCKALPQAKMVSEVVANLPAHAWKRLAVMQGEKGAIAYHWARTRVVESRDRLPGPDVWLLARRSLCDPTQLAYYLAYVPARTSLETKVRVASSRSTVEQCREEAKGEVGLDEYEVRFWHSWYRHIPLSMMAHAWLASIQQLEQGKKVQKRMSLPGWRCRKCATCWRWRCPSPCIRPSCA